MFRLPSFRRPASTDDIEPVDTRTRARLKTLLSSLTKSASNSKLKLPVRAPCLKDILADLLSTLETIFKNNQLEVLVHDDYFPGFVVHLDRLGGSLQTLFNDTPVMILADQISAERAEILRYTLLFNHLCFELKSQFSNGYPVQPINIRLAEGRRFWVQFFKTAHVVSWLDFVAAISEQFGHEEVSEIAGDLKRHVDMCEDGRVSWWEFDVFCQLFQPWDRILNTWGVLTKMHPGYKAWMTYEQVQKMLEPLTNKPGSYCYRLSVTRPGQWAIGFVNPYGLVLQALPTTKSLYQALIDGAADGSYRYPLGQENNIDPREHMPIGADQRIQVSREDHEIYMKMDSTFEVCKICHSGRKNLRMEPCQHLICRKCYDNWNTQQRRESGITVCPFCRSVISVTVPIEVENRHSAEGRKSDGAASAFPTLTRNWRRSSRPGASVRESQFASIEELNAGHSPPRPTSHASGGGPILGGFSADDEGENDDDDNDLEEAIRRSLADVGATSQTASVTEEYGAAAAAAAFSSAAQESPRVSKESREELMRLDKEDLVNRIVKLQSMAVQTDSLRREKATIQEKNAILASQLAALRGNAAASRHMSEEFNVANDLTRQIEKLQVENENVVRRGDATSGELHLLKSRRALHARISLDVPEDIDASAELRAAYSKYDASESQADDLRAQLDALSLKHSKDAQALDALNRRFCHLTTVVLEQAPHLLESTVGSDDNQEDYANFAPSEASSSRTNSRPNPLSISPDQVKSSMV